MATAPARTTVAGTLIGGALLAIGGALLLLQTLFGLFASIMLDFYSVRAVETSLCLTLAFPIFLVVLKWPRVGIWALWVFFLIQWINACFLSSPPVLLNPIANFHDKALLVAIGFVHVGYLLLGGSKDQGHDVAV